MRGSIRRAGASLVAIGVYLERSEERLATQAKPATRLRRVGAADFAGRPRFFSAGASSTGALLIGASFFQSRRARFSGAGAYTLSSAASSSHALAGHPRFLRAPVAAAARVKVTNSTATALGGRPRFTRQLFVVEGDSSDAAPLLSTFAQALGGMLELHLLSVRKLI